MLLQLAQVCLDLPHAVLPTNSAQWEEFIVLAEEHGVAALLWLRVQHLEIPPTARERLKAHYRRNLARASELQREECRVCGALDAQSVTFWPLKGTALSAQLYGDAAARDSSDIDLLISPQQFLACDRALTALAYERTGISTEQACELQEIFYARRVDVVTCGSAEGPREKQGNQETKGQRDSGERGRVLAVDLHLGLMPYGLPDPLGDRIRMQGLTAENLLVYLAVNAVLHRFVSLKHVLDVAAHLHAAAGTLKWDAVVSAARRLAFAPGVWLTVQYAAELARVEVPPAVERSLRPVATLRLAMEAMLGKHLREFMKNSGVRRRLPAGVVFLCTRPGRDWARVAWRMLFPSEAYLRQEMGVAESESMLRLYLLRLTRMLRGRTGP